MILQQTVFIMAKALRASNTITADLSLGLIEYNNQQALAMIESLTMQQYITYSRL